MKKLVLCAIAMAFFGTATLVAQNPPVKAENKTEKKACCDKKTDAKCAKAEKCTKTAQGKACCKNDKHADGKACCKADKKKSCCKDVKKTCNKETAQDGKK
ncbi:MAG: hypothetical protein LBL74_00200 [Bacteroidales bacterium]|jgi:Ni/Co efflux regulator RcnB|nr:hypothetical protein [Bacteroidales bacterium]